MGYGNQMSMGVVASRHTVALGVFHRIPSAVGTKNHLQTILFGQQVSAVGQDVERAVVAGLTPVAAASVGKKDSVAAHRRAVDHDRAVGTFVQGDVVRVNPTAAERSQACAAKRRGREEPVEAQRQPRCRGECVSGSLQMRGAAHRRGLDELKGEQLAGVVDPLADLGQVVGVVAQHVEVVAPGGPDLGLDTRQKRVPSIVGQVGGPQIGAEPRPVDRIMQAAFARIAKGVQAKLHRSRNEGGTHRDGERSPLPRPEDGRRARGTQGQERDRIAFDPVFLAIGAGQEPGRVPIVLQRHQGAGQVNPAGVDVRDGHRDVSSRAGHPRNRQACTQFSRPTHHDRYRAELRHRGHAGLRDRQVVNPGCGPRSG